MNKDFWAMMLRNVLIAASAMMMGAGIASEGEVKGIVQNVDTLWAGVGAAIYLGTTVWQIAVRYRTKTVSTNTGNRPDVPTLSPLTGKKES